MTMDILLAGEMNVDVILCGVKQAPVFGKEILCEDLRECPGGSSENCACAAAALGLSVSYFGRLGTDRYGEIALSALRKFGIATDLMDISPKYRTGVTVSLASDTDRAMITYFGDTIDAFDASEIPLRAANARHLHAGSFYLQPRVRSGLASAFEAAHALGMTTSLDAGWDENGRWHDKLDETLRHTDFFFPNESEAAAITGEAEPERAAIALAGLGCNAIVKCGGAGSVYCARGETRVERAPAYPSRVLDATGAGDGFNAGFLYGFLNGYERIDCLRLGNAAGALSVQRLGGSENSPTLDEVLRVIERGTAL